MRAYLECGILAYGFLRVRCEDCGESRVVAFSCKKRGFCPSCMGRRMADTAARLTEEVLPLVPVRQWVLSFPFEIRYRLAWDGALLSTVLAVFLRVVQGWYRRQARAQGGRCGSVTFVQRSGSSVNLNPHLHVLMMDGVFVRDEDGLPFFVPAPPIPCGSRSPCWRRSQPPRCRAWSPPAIAPDAKCDADSPIPKMACAPAPCVTPRGGSHYMRRRVSRRPTGAASNDSVATSSGRPWPMADCASSTRKRSRSP